MRRVLGAVAVVLTLALVIAPTIFNGCLMPCQLASRARSMAATPPCHHAAAGLAQVVGGEQAGCRHDHGSIASVPDEAASQRMHPVLCAPLASASMAFAGPFAPTGVVLAAGSSPPASLGVASFGPLRI